MKKTTIRPLGQNVIVYPLWRPASTIILPTSVMLHQVFSQCWEWQVISVGSKCDASLVGKKVMIAPNNVEAMELPHPDEGLCMTKVGAIMMEVEK